MSRLYPMHDEPVRVVALRPLPVPPARPEPIRAELRLAAARTAADIALRDWHRACDAQATALIPAAYHRASRACHALETALSEHYAQLRKDAARLALAEVGQIPARQKAAGGVL